MVDAATRTRVQQIVLNYIASGTMFTAYDVTVEARKQGIQLRHDEGKDIVHDMFQTGSMGAGYNRSVIDVGAPTKPFVYHRFDIDPSGYRSMGGTGTPAPPNPAPATTGIVGRFLNRIFGTPSPANQPNSNASPSPGNVPSSASAPSDPAQPTVPRVRAPVTLNLDASSFLPISRTDLIQQSKGRSLWSSPWFGRRDLIPPTSDPRTNLIDRGMVTQGILTPNELVDIHRVGAEMDHFRPAQILIESESRRAGHDAVEAELQSKREAKAKKKAESEERRAQHRERVAHRTETDIQFLGRGVSAHLNERVSDVGKLDALKLPVLASPSDVATAMGLSIPKLRWLAFHAEVATRTHYVSFSVPKKSGGVRTLSAPHALMGRAQRWILCHILDRLPTETSAHGFVTGRNIVSNALPHVGKEVVLNMDMEDFFPSISFVRVRALFSRIGYSPCVATILALICTEAPRRKARFRGETYSVATGPRALPQGACTSPALSNQIVRRLDRRLQGLADRMGISYTRYADDITFSGNETLAARVGYVMACVRHVVQDEGMSVNESKSRVLRRSVAQSVTGLVVNQKPTMSRAKIRRLRAILHRASHEGLDAQNREHHPNFRAWLEGSIAFLSMTRPELGAHMRQQLQRIRP